MVQVYNVKHSLICWWVKNVGNVEVQTECTREAPREDLGASLVHGGSIALLDCLFRHHSKLHSPLQGSLNLTLHKSQVSVHQGSPLMHESFPESSVRTGRVFGPVGQFFMHQGASLEHLRSLRPRAEQTLSGDNSKPGTPSDKSALSTQ